MFTRRKVRAGVTEILWTVNKHSGLYNWFKLLLSGDELKDKPALSVWPSRLAITFTLVSVLQVLESLPR